MFFIDWNNQGISFANLLKCFFFFTIIPSSFGASGIFSHINGIIYNELDLHLHDKFDLKNEKIVRCLCCKLQNLWIYGKVLLLSIVGSPNFWFFFFFFTVEQNITSSSKIRNTMNFTMKNISRTRKIISWKLLFLYQSYF